LPPSFLAQWHCVRANADENVDVNAFADLKDQILEGVSKAAILGAFIGFFNAAIAQHMKKISGKVNRNT
jgi:hypothetical protein